MFDVIKDAKKKVTVTDFIDAFRERCGEIQKQHEERTEERCNLLKEYRDNFHKEYEETAAYAHKLADKRKREIKFNEGVSKIVYNNPNIKNMMEIRQAMIYCYCIMWAVVIAFNYAKGNRGWDLWEANSAFVAFNWIALLLPTSITTRIKAKHFKQGLTRKENKWEDAWFKMFEAYIDADDYIDSLTERECYHFKYVESLETSVRFGEAYKKLSKEYNDLLEKSKKLGAAYEKLDHKYDELMKENVALLRSKAYENIPDDVGPYLND